MGFSRKTFLGFLASVPVVAGLGAVYTRFAEATWFDVTEKDVQIGKFQTPLRILHLSDLHLSDVFPIEDIEKAIDLALEKKPDVAFLTGDFITDFLVDEVEYERVLRKLADHIPTYACIGNHDGGQWSSQGYGYPDFSKVQALLERSGVVFLFNRKTNVSLGGKSFWVAGLGDLWSSDCKPKEVLSKSRDSDEAVFVLSHNPDSKSLLKPYEWDLMCCGHTHGGQLVIPLLGLRPFLPVKDTRFPEGLLSWEGKHIHITRGVGNLHGLRFNCRPEISLLNVI